MIRSLQHLRSTTTFKTPLVLLAFCLVLALPLVGCAEEQGPLEEVGEDLDEAVEDATDAVEDIGDEIEDGVDNVEDAAEEMGEEIDETVDPPGGESH